MDAVAAGKGRVRHRGADRSGPRPACLRDHGADDPATRRIPARDDRIHERHDDVRQPVPAGHLQDFYRRPVIETCEQQDDGLRLAVHLIIFLALLVLVPGGGILPGDRLHQWSLHRSGPTRAPMNLYPCQLQELSTHHTRVQAQQRRRTSRSPRTAAQPAAAGGSPRAAARRSARACDAGRHQQRDHADHHKHHADMNGEPMQAFGALGMRRLVDRAEEADHAETKRFEGQRGADPGERGPVQRQRGPEGRVAPCACRRSSILGSAAGGGMTKSPLRIGIVLVLAQRSATPEVPAGFVDCIADHSTTRAIDICDQEQRNGDERRQDQHQHALAGTPHGTGNRS